MTFITSFSFTLAIASILTSRSNGLPASSDCQAGGGPASVCAPPLKFAVLGDSWASGVAYRESVQYDDNASRCMRNLKSYGVQMKNDVSWAGSNIHFDFPACSGSVMDNMRPQIEQLESPNIIIMTIGGNDIGFFDVVDSCIYYSQKDHDYGARYENDANRTGDCAKAIDKAMAFLKDQNAGFPFRLRNTFSLLLTSSQAQGNLDLRIYQTGYVHFFNVDPGSDWCNDQTFGVYGDPHLSHAVRADMNELVEEANRVIQQVTSAFADLNVGYVSVTERFDEHRFCEPMGTYLGQYFSGNVWFWNLSIPPFAEGNSDTIVTAGLEQPLFDFSNPFGNSTTG